MSLALPLKLGFCFKLFFIVAGTTQGIAIIENLIEHLAKSRQEDPFEFRMKNLNTVGSNEISPMRKIIDEVRQSSEYENRLNEVRLIVIVKYLTLRFIFRGRSRNSIETIDGKNEESIFFPWFTQ